MSKRLSQWAPLPLRLILGFGFVYHGFPKLLQHEGFVDRLEERRGGRKLDSYDLVGLNTRIVGNVAYTSSSSTNWLELAIFVRSGEQWLVDRWASVRVPRDEP